MLLSNKYIQSIKYLSISLFLFAIGFLISSHTIQPISINRYLIFIPILIFHIYLFSLFVIKNFFSTSKIPFKTFYFTLISGYLLYPLIMYAFGSVATTILAFASIFISISLYTFYLFAVSTGINFSINISFFIFTFPSLIILSIGHFFFFKSVYISIVIFIISIFNITYIYFGLKYALIKKKPRSLTYYSDALTLKTFLYPVIYLYTKLKIVIG